MVKPYLNPNFLVFLNPKYQLYVKIYANNHKQQNTGSHVYWVHSICAHPFAKHVCEPHEVSTNEEIEDQYT